MKTIKQTSGFSSDRFIHLCKRFIAINQRTWAIGFAGAMSLIIAIWLLFSFADLPDNLIYSTISTLLQEMYLLGGLIITSVMFNELHNTGTASQMLTLPASTFEKLFSVWFLSYLCFTIFAFTLIVLIHFIFGLSMDISGTAVNSTGTGKGLFGQFLSYTVFHSVFLLGAIYFRKNNFVKTLLAIILFFLSFGLIYILLYFISGVDYGSSILYSETIIGLSAGSAWIFGVAISITTAALFLFFSFIRLKNRQIT